MSWYPLTAALDPAWTATRIERLAEGAGHGRRPPAVAGSYFSGDLSWTIAHPAAVAFGRDATVLAISLDNVRVHFGDEGWPDRIEFVHDRRRTGTAGDLADALVATLGPIFDIVRSLTPYGYAGMWGSLADHIATSLWELHYDDTGGNGVGGAAATDDKLVDVAWERLSQVIAELGRREPRLRARPRRFHFAAASPPVDLPMRGSCCLKFKAPEAAFDDEPMCSTCPRRSDPERVALVNQRFLDEAAGRAH